MSTETELTAADHEVGQATCREHGGRHTVCHVADETCGVCDESRGADQLTSSEQLRQHIEAARTQAFAEVAQVVDVQYRKAFDEFGKVGVAIGTASDPEARRLFWIMDTWCLALQVVRTFASDPAPAPSRPEIVVLCGSTRFKDAFREAARSEAMAGRIVLTVSDLDPRREMRHVNVPIDAETKARLDELHRHKIDLADRVLVLNVGGYIGESTRSEIEYATVHGKPIGYSEPAAGAVVTGPDSEGLQDPDGSDAPHVDRICSECGARIKVLVSDLDGPDDQQPVACWGCQ